MDRCPKGPASHSCCGTSALKCHPTNRQINSKYRYAKEERKRFRTGRGERGEGSRGAGEQGRGSEGEGERGKGEREREGEGRIKTF